MSEKLKSYKLASGKKVTGKELDKLAKDFASGKYDPTLSRRRGRPTLGSKPAQVVQVRLTPELLKLLKKKAKQDKTTNSDVMREALQRYLAS